VLFMTRAGARLSAQRAQEVASLDGHPSETVTAQELIDDYKRNEIEADSRYKGHVLEVGGRIGGIHKDIADNPYITLQSGRQREFREVQCWLASVDRTSDLKPSDSVTVRGIGAGLMGNVLLRPCKVAAKSAALSATPGTGPPPPTPTTPMPTATATVTPAASNAPSEPSARTAAESTQPRPRLYATVEFDNRQSIRVEGVEILPPEPLFGEAKPTNVVLLREPVTRLGVESVEEKAIPVPEITNISYYERQPEADESASRLAPRVRFPECTCVLTLKSGERVNIEGRAAYGPRDTEAMRYPPYYSLRAEGSGGRFSVKSLLSCPKVKDGDATVAVIGIMFGLSQPRR